jgi:hypothetical protein
MLFAKQQEQLRIDQERQLTKNKITPEALQKK